MKLQTAAEEAHDTEWLKDKRTAKNTVDKCIVMHMRKDNINVLHTVMGYEQVINTQK